MGLQIIHLKRWPKGRIMAKEYNFTEIENKWKNIWEKNKTFKTDIWDFSKPKYYVLDMFPYPSGQGLHVGHPEGYTATDIVARYRKMKGFNVLHPMGFDSFGLPAEQYAVATGNHPDEFTNRNIKIFESQLKMLGFAYDWDREISTCDPAYYKWTQWIFKKLYEDNLARCADLPVNWCEELGTVLANDEVVDGKSERGGFPVVRKNMKQWIIDTPAYAEKLLNGLENLNWPYSTKEIQKNWIGKSQGVEVKFNIRGGGEFKIFTTCIETIYGITFMVLAPESKIVEDLKPRIKNLAKVEKYIAETIKKSDLERGELNKGKSGCKLEGIVAINPANNKEVPVYIADFVISQYGTGAVMAVPTHDQRDYEFAIKHNIPMVEVISGGDISKCAFEKQDYLGKGCKLINSNEFDGLTVEEAKKAITDKLVKNGVAEIKTNYRLREWIFARQRYWGEPIPIVHFEDGSMEVLDDNELPLVLPKLTDYKAKNGRAPLENASDWVNINYKGRTAKRETLTMPGSAASSWYFLRYLDPKNDKELADKKLIQHWLPVDLYVGGPEHAVGHLLYSRFFNNYLYDKGIVSVREPFKKLVHQGMILGENNEKMSKSRGNVINPNDVVAKYGADTLRLYEMFMGALQDSKPWNTKNIEGSKRFLDRVWRLYTSENKIANRDNSNLDKIYNETVKKVSEDYESLDFNTAISQMMIFINTAYKEDVFPQKYAEGFLKLLNPIAPFITEELWQQVFNRENMIANENWPTYDEKELHNAVINLPVQINGKMRGTIRVLTNATQEEILTQVKENENFSKYLIEGIKKVIYVPQRIMNVIV